MNKFSYRKIQRNSLVKNLKITLQHYWDANDKHVVETPSQGAIEIRAEKINSKQNVIANCSKLIRISGLKNQLIHALLFHINASRGAAASNCKKKDNEWRNQEAIKPFEYFDVFLSLLHVDYEELSEIAIQLGPIAIKLSPFTRYEKEIYINEQSGEKVYEKACNEIRWDDLKKTF